MNWPAYFLALGLFAAACGGINSIGGRTHLSSQDRRGDPTRAVFRDTYRVWMFLYLVLSAGCLVLGSVWWIIST